MRHYSGRSAGDAGEITITKQHAYSPDVTLLDFWQRVGVENWMTGCRDGVNDKLNFAMVGANGSYMLLEKILGDVDGLDCAHRYFIVLIFVPSEHRRRGLAAALLEAARCFDLVAMAEDEEADAMFEKAGFIKLQTPFAGIEQRVRNANRNLAAQAEPLKNYDNAKTKTHLHDLQMHPPNRPPDWNVMSSNQRKTWKWQQRK
jgi:GNAT superfamily N-acetyltransferase